MQEYKKKTLTCVPCVTSQVCQHCEEEMCYGACVKFEYELHEVVSVILLAQQIDGVAPFVRHPPSANSTPCKINPWQTPLLYIAQTCKPICCFKIILGLGLTLEGEALLHWVNKELHMV